MAAQGNDRTVAGEKDAIDLDWARKALLDKRAALLGRIEADAVPADVATTPNDEMREPGDVADASVKDTNVDGALLDAERATDAVRLVNEALDRLNRGTYGECIDCGEPIDPRRLRSLPEAPRCTADQERYDQEHMTGAHHATL